MSFFHLFNLTVLRSVIALHNERVKAGSPVLMSDQSELLLVCLVPVAITQLVCFLQQHRALLDSYRLRPLRICTAIWW